MKNRTLIDIFQKFKKDCEGSAILESAVALPFVLLFGALVLEFGYYFGQLQAAQAGLTDAVRYLSHSSYSGDPNTTMASQISTAQNIARFGASSMAGQTQTPRSAGLVTIPQFTFVPVTSISGPYSGSGTFYVVRGSWTIQLAQYGIVSSLPLVSKSFTINYEQRMMGG